MEPGVLCQMIPNSQTDRPSFDEHPEVSIGLAVVGYGGLAYYGQLQMEIDILKQYQLTFPNALNIGKYAAQVSP